MELNPKMKIGLAFVLFVVIYYFLPSIFSCLEFLNEYASEYPLIYPQVIYGLSSWSFIFVLSKKIADYGLTLVNFNWLKVFLIICCIQAFPFITFLFLLSFGNLYLSGWMLLPLLEIVIVYLILSPLIEELFFRGLIQTLCFPLSIFKLKLKGLVISVPLLITAILFTMIHFSYSILALIFIFSLGLLCGHLREKYESIIPGIFAHFVFNFFAVFVPRLILLFLESKYH